MIYLLDLLSSENQGMFRYELEMDTHKALPPLISVSLFFFMAPLFFEKSLQIASLKLKTTRQASDHCKSFIISSNKM